MIARLGRSIYLIACLYAIIPAQLATVLFFNALYDPQAELIDYLYAGVAQGCAVILWLIGRTLRYILADE